MDFDRKAMRWDDPEKMERAVRVAQLIKKRVPLNVDMNVLDYGCGTGLLSLSLYPDLEKIMLMDSSQGMLDVTRDKLKQKNIRSMTTVLMDLGLDGIPSTKFDLIVSMMTLHHVKDIGLVLSKFHQLLSSPGWLCIADLDTEDGSFHDHLEGVHNGFDRDQLKEQIRDLGYINIHFDNVMELSRTNRPDQRYTVFLMTAQKPSLNG